MCAERVALGAAIAAGERDFSLLALVADSNEPIVPCGACRQVLAEFNPALRIITSNLEGQSAELSLDHLLPKARQGILG
jgi:cytidine deaminase